MNPAFTGIEQTGTSVNCIQIKKSQEPANKKSRVFLKMNAGKKEYRKQTVTVGGKGK